LNPSRNPAGLHLNALQRINVAIINGYRYSDRLRLGPGGTRESHTSFSIHTCSVNPAAIAGVHGRHT
jgi:hypothetical protein